MFQVKITQICIGNFSITTVLTILDKLRSKFLGREEEEPRLWAEFSGRKVSYSIDQVCRHRGLDLCCDRGVGVRRDCDSDKVGMGPGLEYCVTRG